MMLRLTLYRACLSSSRVGLAALLAVCLTAALAGVAPSCAAASPWSAVTPPWDASSPTNNISSFGTTGLAVAGDGHVAVTRDGGRSWSVVVPGGLSGAVFTTVAFDASGRGIVASGGVLLATADWGATWTTPSFTGVAPRAAIDDLALRGSAAVAVGDGGLIMSSGDGGATWSTESSPTTADITCVAIAGDGTAVAGTATGEVLVGAAGTWTQAGALAGPVTSVAASATPVWGAGQPDLFAADGTAVVGSDDGKNFVAVAGLADAGTQSWPLLAWVGAPEHSLLMAGAADAGFLDLLTQAWLPGATGLSDTTAAVSPGGQSVAYLLGADGTLLRTLSAGREPATVSLTRAGIVVGASVGLTAQVSVAAPGRLIVLGRVPGGSWKVAGTAPWTAADYGESRAFTFSPQLTHQYLVEFKYGGSTTELAPAATVVVTPKVSPTSARITLHVGDTYRFTGSVTPALPGESVVLFTDRGGSWRPVTSQGPVTLQNGRTWTSRSFGTPYAETYHLRARLSATAKHGVAWSRIVTVAVR